MQSNIKFLIMQCENGVISISFHVRKVRYNSTMIKSGQKFNRSLIYGSVAQQVVHVLGKDEVSGSNPLGASIIITIRYKDFYSVAE